MLLIGDIGATHARLALITPEHGLQRPVRELVLPSQQYEGLEQVIAEFLGDSRPPIRRAVFAVAGPVLNGRAELTNVSWVVDEAELQAALDVSDVYLLNDLLALAHAVPTLAPEDLHTLQRGEPAEGGALAVVAPGTGLGEAFLTWDGTRYRAHPSEAGHADFAPADRLQQELLAWLRVRFNPVSYELVCSGSGLTNLYDFLKSHVSAQEESWLAEKLAAAKDRSPVIVDAAFATEASPLAAAAVELFAIILAAEAGNAALRFLATGGVYLGGGMPRRVLPLLQRQDFLERFRQKDRTAELMARVPLHVIVARGVALRGAACLALRESAHR
jgi:glucokinase